MNSQEVLVWLQAARLSADRSLSLERNSMTNKRPRRRREHVSSSAHAFQASQLFRNCAFYPDLRAMAARHLRWVKALIN